MSKNELIENAVLQLNGEWPKHREDDVLIVSTENNSHWGAGQFDFYVHKQDVRTDAGVIVWSYVCTREEFNAAADRMRGKPDWKEVLAKHPEAQYLAQWPGDTGCGTGANAGLWISYKNEPRCAASGYLVDAEVEICYHSKGVLLGDWRNTLEKRSEQKADPLNGYQWGVEYPTGKDYPNVADDVIIQAKDLAGNWRSGSERKYWRWDYRDVTAFKITDQRYKPTEPAPDKPWFEAGELPAVGEIVMVNIFQQGAHEATVIGAFQRWVWLDVKNKGIDTFDVSYISPIKTDKEKAIEAAAEVLNTPEINSNIDATFTLRLAAEALYDAGLLRLPDQK